MYHSFCHRTSTQGKQVKPDAKRQGSVLCPDCVFFLVVRPGACGRSFGRSAESRNAAAGGRGRHCGKPVAVGESEEQRKPERFSGYRKAESRNAAAGGRVRHCGITAAVGESEERRKPERFSGYRKADRGRFLIREVIRGRRSFPGCMSAPDFGFLQLRGRGACRLAFRFSFFLFRISFSLPYGCREAGIKSQVILDRKGHSP